MQCLQDSVNDYRDIRIQLLLFFSLKMDTFSTQQVNCLIALIRYFDPSLFSYEKTFIKSGKRVTPEEAVGSQEKEYRQTFSAFITRLSPRVQGDL